MAKMRLLEFVRTIADASSSEAVPNSTTSTIPNSHDATITSRARTITNMPKDHDMSLDERRARWVEVAQMDPRGRPIRLPAKSLQRQGVPSASGKGPTAERVLHYTQRSPQRSHFAFGSSNGSSNEPGASSPIWLPIGAAAGGHPKSATKQSSD